MTAADIAEDLLVQLRLDHPAEADDVLGALVVNTVISHLVHPEGGQAFAAAVNLRLAEAVTAGRVWQLVEIGADRARAEAAQD